MAADFERFRSYLHLIARLECRDGTPIDSSDVVQQTLIDAWRDVGNFRGTTEAERAAWLRQILIHNLADWKKANHRQKRDIQRTQSLDATIDLPGDQSSPSQRALREEQAARLADAMAQLPEAQREALMLQHWHGLTLAQIGERMDKSPVAIAGLLKRGLQKLRELLPDERA